LQLQNQQNWKWQYLCSNKNKNKKQSTLITTHQTYTWIVILFFPHQKQQQKGKKCPKEYTKIEFKKTCATQYSHHGCHTWNTPCPRWTTSWALAQVNCYFCMLQGGNNLQKTQGLGKFQQKEYTQVDCYFWMLWEK